jgi:hypothetical protein
MRNVNPSIATTPHTLFAQRSHCEQAADHDAQHEQRSRDRVLTEPSEAGVDSDHRADDGGDHAHCEQHVGVAQNFVLFARYGCGLCAVSDFGLHRLLGSPGR